MKLHVLSDLHLEFAPFAPSPTDADVVILAGDIGTRLSGIRMARETFDGRPVVYVAGNHEYYGAAIPALTTKLRREALGTNVHLLENDAVVIDGVRFLGCTLWTDFALFGADDRHAAMLRAETGMNDFRKIRRSPRFGRLRAVDTLAFHRRSTAWLEAALAEPGPGPTVVVTHHAPHRRSVAAEYRGDPLAPAFVSHLAPLFDGGRIDLWVHGHTHRQADYVERGVRVVSNQRGYPDEPADRFDPGLVVEV